MDSDAILALSPFALLSLFVTLCMFVKVSDKYFMGSIYTAPIVAKIISGIGFIGFWTYVGLCADYIPNSYNLEFNGWIAFGILGVSTVILAATGVYKEE